VLPRSLFGRTLLIVLVPLILSEAVALQIFYGSHLDVLSRRLAFSVAGEIAFVVDAADRNPARRQVIFNRAALRFEFAFHEHPGRPFVAQLPPHAFGPVDQDLIAALRTGLGRPFALVWHGPPGMIRVDIAEPGGVLTVDVPRKRLYVGQLYIFFAWLAGTTILLLGLATLFLRNQVRGIKRLAGAAEAFGMGRDAGPIRPEGAAEIRRAGAAFNRMRDRVRRFLAGVPVAEIAADEGCTQQCIYEALARSEQRIANLLEYRRQCKIWALSGERGDRPDLPEIDDGATAEQLDLFAFDVVEVRK
jgi:two-component system osmolarity sensor histidine kinase EnvZ